MDKPVITLQTILCIPEDVLLSEAGDEAVILNLAIGKYYGLDDIGTRIWTLIAEHGQLELVQHALLQEYAVDSLQLEQDLLELAGKLVARGLLHIIAE